MTMLTTPQLIAETRDLMARLDTLREHLSENGHHLLTLEVEWARDGLSKVDHDLSHPYHRKPQG